MSSRLAGSSPRSNSVPRIEGSICDQSRPAALRSEAVPQILRLQAVVTTAIIAADDKTAQHTPPPIAVDAGAVVIDKDEQPGKASPEKIPTLKPAFRKSW